MKNKLKTVRVFPLTVRKRDRVMSKDFEEVLKKMSSISDLTIEIKNPNYNPDKITSDGFENDLLDSLWKNAKENNADFTRFTLTRVGTAENWNVEVIMYSPDRYKGYRKHVKKLADYLLKF